MEDYSGSTGQNLFFGNLDPQSPVEDLGSNELNVPIAIILSSENIHPNSNVIIPCLFIQQGLGHKMH